MLLKAARRVRRPEEKFRCRLPPACAASAGRTSHASSPAVRTRISRPSKTSRQPSNAAAVVTCATRRRGAAG